MLEINGNLSETEAEWKPAVHSLIHTDERDFSIGSGTRLSGQACRMTHESRNRLGNNWSARKTLEKNNEIWGEQVRRRQLAVAA
jgi:hypothetical protein